MRWVSAIYASGAEHFGLGHGEDRRRSQRASSLEFEDVLTVSMAAGVPRTARALIAEALERSGASPFTLAEVRTEL